MTDKWIFITGGCGFIGGNLAAVIKNNTNYKVLLIDKRAKQLAHTIRYSDLYADEEFDSDLIRDTIFQYNPVAIVHLAGTSSISSGLIDPINQWKGNVDKTLNLVKMCMESEIKNFIFASTSSIYKDSDEAISETGELDPTNSYSSGKLAVEHILRDCWISNKFSSISLRMFNASGAHHHLDLGELPGNSHILPSMMNATVNNIPFSIFGRDWPTEDKTAIRDYIHVLDIADAIIDSIEWSQSNKGCHIFNVGSGSSNSVQSIVDITEKLLNKELPYRYADRRDGDTAKRFANIDKIINAFGWKPKRSIDDIVRDSFKWYNSATFKNLKNAGIYSEY